MKKEINFKDCIIEIMEDIKEQDFDNSMHEIHREHEDVRLMVVSIMCYSLLSETRKEIEEYLKGKLEDLKRPVLQMKEMETISKHKACTYTLMYEL